MQIKSDLDLRQDENLKNNDILGSVQFRNEKPLVPTSKIIKREKFSPLLRQIFVSLGPILATITAGLTSGYSAVLLPQLQKNDSEIRITQDEASWIASMAALPMAVGCIMGGIIMERYGRRMAHLVLNIPFLIGWIIISMASDINLILIGRFLTGICVGLLGPPASVYIGETSEPKYRGFLLASVSLAIAIGILVSHVLGTFLTWKVTAMICGIFPLLSFVHMTYAPESPSWLLSKGRIEDASNSFKWLRGFDESANREFESMLANQNTSGSVSNYSWIKIKENVRRPAFLKPLGILLGFFFTMQFAGVNAVAFYSVTILKQTLGNGINEYLATILIDVIRLIMSIVACVLLRKYERRLLVTISGTGTTISLIGLSVFLYLASKDVEILQYSWIPMTLLVSFISFVSIGIVPLPWCMTGELFPLSLRGMGSAIVSSANFLCLFIVIKTVPMLFLNIGAEGAFLIYGGIALIGTIFLIICLPETKDRTLQEIENNFECKKPVIQNEKVIAA